MKPSRYFLHIIFLAISVSLITSCDRRLPAEEQQRLQEKASERRIQRVTENQMIEYVQERSIELEIILDTLTNQSEAINLIQEYLHMKHPVSYVKPGEAGEKELAEVMEAYMFSIAEGSGSGSNIQKLENGNILFTIPHVEDSSGITILRGLYKVEFIRKEMVNDIFRELDIQE